MTKLGSNYSIIKLLASQKAGPDGRPVWFVFAGMGTQWHGMGRDLMQLDTFKQSIMRSDAILRQHGLQLYDMLMNGDQSTFNQTLNSFVGIAAIQVLKAKHWIVRNLSHSNCK